MPCVIGARASRALEGRCNRPSQPGGARPGAAFGKDRGLWRGARSRSPRSISRRCFLAGHPWSITWGFTLWAAKVAAAVGWEPSASAFWTSPFQRAALENSLFADVTSVMNFGILLGALSAAALAGRFAPTLRLPLPTLVAVIIGGLMMGYGARLAFGCNIGAFFSGVASLSLHGWLWIVCALAGTAIGVRLRGLFGLINETRAAPARPAPTAP